jgi:hypothetical protein
MHIDRDALVEYLQIYLEHNKIPLEVSYNHLLMNETTHMNAVRAQDVKVGDILSGSKIHRRSVQRRGLYLPVTKSGTILVSGVTASCYVDILSSLTMIPSTFQAHLSQAALTPLRLLCAWKFALCQNETYSDDGISSNLVALTQFGLLATNWNGMHQWLVVILFAPVLIALIALIVLETCVMRYWLFVTSIYATVVGAVWVLFYVGKKKQWDSIVEESVIVYEEDGIIKSEN